MLATVHPARPTARAGALAQALDAARETLRRPHPELLVINDPQRATDSPSVLALAHDYFDLGRARILVATGSHRFGPEARQAFEAPLRQLGFEAIAWHDARATDLVDIGGLRVHRWLADAYAVLCIGSVEPHYFAGFTGAHKSLTIGCASYEDIEGNHEGAMDPACRPCSLETSAVHRGVLRMLAAVENGRRVAAVNLFQADTDLLDAAGGTALDALHALLPVAKQTYLHSLPRPVDAVVASVRGALACSFYQAEKGLKNNEAAVRDGGVFVLDAPCPDGLGQDAFVRLLERAATHEAALAQVQKQGYRLGDHKAVRLRYLTDRNRRDVRLYVVSDGITDAQCAILGARKAASVQSALVDAGVDEQRHDVVHVEDAGNCCLESVEPIGCEGREDREGRKP